MHCLSVIFVMEESEPFFDCMLLSPCASAFVFFVEQEEVKFNSFTAGTFSSFSSKKATKESSHCHQQMSSKLLKILFLHVQRSGVSTIKLLLTPLFDSGTVKHSACPVLAAAQLDLQSCESSCFCFQSTSS